MTRIVIDFNGKNMTYNVPYTPYARNTRFIHCHARYGGVPVVDDVYTRVFLMTLTYIGILYVQYTHGTPLTRGFFIVGCRSSQSSHLVRCGGCLVRRCSSVYGIV